MDDLNNLRDRMYSAEDALNDLIRELWEYVDWLDEPSRGPVIFRSEVVERLTQLLDK